MKDGDTRFNEKLEERAKKSPPLKVLVVDDDPSTLHLLKTALTAIDNYDVTTANSAHKAIDLLEDAEVPFDCLLLDIQMPETDGIVLLRGIREIPEYTDTPILMLTAMSERSYVDEAFRAGATDYITKPFDLIDLRGRMNSARRLVRERLKAERKQETVAHLKGELEKKCYFNFDDPLAIEGADRHLRFIEFDNYVDQLSRGQLFKSHTIALKIQDARTLYDATNCEFFRKAVQDTAQCLQSMTSDIDCMFSYRGSGLFLAVVHDEMSLHGFPKEEKLNTYVQTMFGGRGGADAWVHILVGEPASMRSLSRSGSVAAIKKAIKDVEAREQAAGEDPGNDEGQGFHEPGSGRPTSKRVYERVLMELYGSESYLNFR